VIAPPCQESPRSDQITPEEATTGVQTKAQGGPILQQPVLATWNIRFKTRKEKAVKKSFLPVVATWIIRLKTSPFETE
jgi:hypothetical protein